MIFNIVIIVSYDCMDDDDPIVKYEQNELYLHVFLTV